MIEILINNLKTISEVQYDFSREFPFLKLEFFNTAYVAEKALPKSKMFSQDKKLGTIRKVQTNGKIIITADQTVNDLEKELWEKFGLSGQVFRKSGNLWIETSLTDSWTLEQQNREGYEMSKLHNKV